MVRLNLPRTLALLAVATLCFLFQNCSDVQFDNIDPVEKEKTLDESTVFNPPPLQATPPPVAMTPPVAAAPPPPAVVPAIAAGSLKLNFKNAAQCAPSEFSEKTPVPNSYKKLPIFSMTLKDKKTNTVVCNQTNIDLDTSTLGYDHDLTIPNCKLETGKTYVLSGTAKLSNGSFIEVVGTDSIGSYNIKPIDVYVVGAGFGLNKDEQTINSNQSIVLFYTVKDCSEASPQLVSPLVIDLKADQDERKTIDISGLDDGIDFDVLGENSFPVPFAPKRIGWTNNPRYGFLVLPNGRGQVNGINEMFGDNTRGPDGNFAENGFLALKKYDSSNDDVISARDEVYSRLRVWTDANYNGVAEPSELKRLAEVNIAAIDLNYDGTYKERDQHGNETTLKSVVKKHDGTYNLIFDLWFVYREP